MKNRTLFLLSAILLVSGYFLSTQKSISSHPSDFRDAPSAVKDLGLDPKATGVVETDPEHMGYTLYL